MNDRNIAILYGDPPRGLVEIPANSNQFSPLMPGSAKLKDYASSSLTGAVVYAPPGTLERRYVLARVLMALQVGAKLTALALKDKGGSRIAAELEAFGCEVADDSRSHHRIVTTTRPAQMSGIEEALAQGGLQ
ncbi:MAG: hypothetical protein ACOYNL_11300, partial [Rickettsiales bacterium]